KKKDDKDPPFQVNEPELQVLTERVAQRKIEESDWETLHRYLVLFLKLSQVLQYGKIRMKKIARMLFGKRTEKEKEKKGPPDNPPGGNPAPTAEEEQRSGSTPLSDNQNKEAKKGHGRRPASDYQNAETQVCPLCHNKPG